MLSHKPFIVVTGMNTRRSAARRFDEGIANAGAQDNQAPPQDNQVHLIKEIAMGDKILVVPSPMIDREIRKVCITSKDNVVTSEV